MRWLRNLFARPAPSEAPAAEVAPTPPSVSAAPADGSDWVSHQRSSAEGPVAIAVDLALLAGAPDPARTRVARLRCQLKAPSPDGQPGPDEAERLAGVEDALARELAPLGAAYAGRVTLAGAREHLFYLSEAAPVAEALDRASAAIATHDLTLIVDDDPTWHAYRAELYPTPRTLRFLLDRRALEAAARRGGAGSRPVDHQAAFPSAEAREAFSVEAATQGFAAVARRDDAPAPNPFAIDLRRSDPLALRELHAVTWSLVELAGRHGGAYDGWELDQEG